MKYARFIVVSHWYSSNFICGFFHQESMIMIEGICPKLFPFPCFLAQLEAFLKYEYCRTLMRLCASEEICIPPSRWSYVFTFNEWSKKKLPLAAFWTNFRLKKSQFLKLKLKIQISYQVKILHFWSQRWKLIFPSIHEMLNLQSGKFCI